jgi:hypothetical protein
VKAFLEGVIPSGAVLQAERGISRVSLPGKKLHCTAARIASPRFLFVRESA